jgi:uncharacterized protein (TIGR03435 family)
MFLALAACALSAQDLAHFEVATIKVSTDDTPPPARGFGRVSGGPDTTSPGQFAAFGISLKNILLRDAFNLEEFQYVAPSWMSDHIYDVVAKVPPGTNRDQFRVMLQDLLIERFRIVLHHEQRTTEIYELTIGKGGLKMKPSPYNEQVPQVHPALKRDVDGLLMLPQDAGPATIFTIGNGGQVVWESTRGPFQQLVTMLSRNPHRRRDRSQRQFRLPAALPVAGLSVWNSRQNGSSARSV